MEGEKGQHPEEIQKAGSTGGLKILGRERILDILLRPYVVNKHGRRQESAGEPSEILVR